jgi:hypothetical protein
MKPFHLHVWLDSRAAALTCQWFGLSAIHAAGSAHYVLRPDAGATLVPHPCLIDIRQRGRACFNPRPPPRLAGHGSAVPFRSC